MTPYPFSKGTLMFYNIVRFTISSVLCYFGLVLMFDSIDRFFDDNDTPLDK